MYDSDLDHYFELAMDMPERKRAALLDRLEADRPELASQLRSVLRSSVTNADFVAARGVGGARNTENVVPPQLDILHHVAIQVDDIPAAVAWYRDRFACEVDYADATWALLRFGNLRLALVTPREHPPHFAISRPDAARFGELHEHRDGTRSVYVSDPWGNRVEIVDHTSLPPAP